MGFTGLSLKGRALRLLSQREHSRAELQRSELERAREVWRRKFGEPAADPQTRAKHMRFLLVRGFSGDVARRAVLGVDASDEG